MNKNNTSRCENKTRDFIKSMSSRKSYRWSFTQLNIRALSQETINEFKRKLINRLKTKHYMATPFFFIGKEQEHSYEYNLFLVLNGTSFSKKTRESTINEIIDATRLTILEMIDIRITKPSIYEISDIDKLIELEDSLCYCYDKYNFVELKELAEFELMRELVSQKCKFNFSCSLAPKRWKLISTA